MEMTKFKTKPYGLYSFYNDDKSELLPGDVLSMESLQSIIKKLSKLNKQGFISDDQLSRLVTIACSKFIESEIDNRLSRILDKSVMHIFKFH
jgi:hypothetical protein